VGIGTASFNSKLAVSGSNFQGGSLQIIRTDTSSNFALGGTTSGAFQIYDVTAGNLTRLVIDSNGDVTFLKNISVGNATPTTSGTGITFPATQSASSDANTLDDYEEGTFTIAAAPNSGSITLVSGAGGNLGFYTRIGRVVTITAFINVASVSSPSSDLYFTGLPFTIFNSNANYPALSVLGGNLTSGATTALQGYGVRGNTIFSIEKFAAGAGTALSSNVQATTFFFVTLTYQAA
jgi:hypothetical protein